ncbi:unnamed protein product [Discula destructiva]
MDFPERLRQKEGDEEHEETVRPFGLGHPSQTFANMSTNILGLLSATNPKVDYHNRFAGYSSEEDANDSADEGTGRKKRTDAATDPMAQTMILTKPGSKNRKRSTGHKLMQSVPMLSRLSSRKSSKDGQPPALNIPEESEGESSADENNLAPHMSRILEARAEVESRPSFDLERHTSKHKQDPGDQTGSSPTDLAKRLQEIFGFDEPEGVISEYPCYLLQGMLLQGFIYITSKHICFYAYLPKKAHETTKTGYLSKSGKRNPRYSRYWFQLKGDVLSYYEGTTNKYFPHGHIDLRYGITASLADKDKEGLHFTLETDHRTYYFRADTSYSAKDWVSSLQRVIFRSRNEGDSVKISLPIRNVIDIEEIKMLDLETCKLRVIDNDETYAVDEYFFSFFHFGKDAINILKILIEDEHHRDNETEALDLPPSADVAFASSGPTSQRTSFANTRAGRATPAMIPTGRIGEQVRATLSPMSPRSPTALSPRPSGDCLRGSFDAIRQLGRRSLDHPRGETPLRRSFSQSRQRSSSGRRYGTSRHASAHSTSGSTDDPSIASLSGMTTSGELDASASQILVDSDVFHSPTVQRPASTKGEESEQRISHRHVSVHRSKHSATTIGSLTDAATGGKSDALPPTPTLDMISKVGSYPLQRVGAFADYLTRGSKRVGGLLTTESTSLAGRVSGMLKGGSKHYDEAEAPGVDMNSNEAEQNKAAEQRFQAHFALPVNERLRATSFGYFVRVLPLYGKFYVSDRTICFRSILPGTRTKLILPIEDIENVSKSNGFRLGYSGLVITIRRHEELFFEFGDKEHRDDLAVFLHRGIENRTFLQGSADAGDEANEEAERAIAEQKALEAARQEEFPEHEPHFKQQIPSGPEAVVFDDVKASMVDFKPTKPLHFTCLTIGSRGDVQPYIALCKGLIADGHKAKIATHAEFKDWIEGHGIEFGMVEGDPADLMRLCIENGTFTVAFLQKASSTMRTWLDGLLATSWAACQGTDVLIESPSAMAGIHIAEKMRIPYFRAFGMPWTRTRTYPHAFLTPERKLGGSFNIATYAMFDYVFWQGTARQINNWRKSMLHLPSTSLVKLKPNHVPFLYNFSPEVVPPPMDFSDWIRVTGYWFLDEGGKDWTPPAELVAFISKAREDGKKLVYIGFGSIILDNPAKFTREIIDAVVKADVRCILSKGWSDRLDATVDPGSAETQSQVGVTEVPLPSEIYPIKSAPHDWLFNQIDAAAHHGGSGTTGASLRAGIPTIVRPFFGDQFFFGGRVEDLGVGILLKKWGAKSFARALWEATNSERMIVKARALGERIRKENGVDTAIQCIYRDMSYAMDLIEAKASKNGLISDSEDVEDEEEWTFIGDGDHDPVSDNEDAEPSLSRHLPSQSVIWTGSAPTGPRSPLSGRSGSHKSSSAGSGHEHTSMKEK